MIEITNRTWANVVADGSVGKIPTHEEFKTAVNAYNKLAAISDFLYYAANHYAIKDDELRTEQVRALQKELRESAKAYMQIAYRYDGN